jgi:hypothetical protein
MPADLRLSPSAIGVQPAIDLGDLLDPLPALPVFQMQDVVQRPVKVIRDVGYLLVQAIKGVAYDSPPRFARSSSNSSLQWGQVIGRVVLPVSLICW